MSLTQSTRPCVDFEFHDALNRQEVRRDCDTLRLVILIQPIFLREEDIPEEHLSMPWLVKDILSGQIYVLEELRVVGRVYNEMEALAWAAYDHPDIEISGN